MQQNVGLANKPDKTLKYIECTAALHTNDDRRRLLQLSNKNQEYVTLFVEAFLFQIFFV